MKGLRMSASTGGHTLTSAYDPLADFICRNTVYTSWRSDLPENMYAATNGTDVIWLSRQNITTHAGLRAVMAHELVHIDMGHCDGQTPEVEREVSRIAAQRLGVTVEGLRAMHAQDAR